MDINEKFIAIVDDSEPMRSAIASHLANTNFQFIEAVDGRDGIELVKKYSGKISLLIIDLNMPKLNGIEMMEKLAANSIGNDIPKILLINRRILSRNTAGSFSIKYDGTHELRNPGS